VGDWVLSKPEDDPEGVPVPRQVVELIRNYVPLLGLNLGGRVVRTSAEHPFWVRGRGWTAAHQMMTGDHLLSHEGRWLVLDSVEGGQELATVYNVQVEEYHTYFVGGGLWGFSVWAHNAACNSYYLGQSLKKAGQPNNLVGGQAAHVVPTGAWSRYPATVQDAIQKARGVLSRAGIGINSAENGFWAFPGHNGTHSSSYALQLGKRLSKAEMQGDVAAELASIRKQAESGYFQ